MIANYRHTCTRVHNPYARNKVFLAENIRFIDVLFSCSGINHIMITLKQGKLSESSIKN